MLLYGRNQYNIVNVIIFQLKVNLKKCFDCLTSLISEFSYLIVMMNPRILK